MPHCQGNAWPCSVPQSVVISHEANIGPALASHLGSALELLYGLWLDCPALQMHKCPRERQGGYKTPIALDLEPWCFPVHGPGLLCPGDFTLVYPRPCCWNRRGNLFSATRQRAANSISPGARGQLGSAPSASICQPAGKLLLQPAAPEQQDVGNQGSPGSRVMVGGGFEHNGWALCWHLALLPTSSAAVLVSIARAITRGRSPGQAGRCGGCRAVNTAPVRERMQVRVSCSPPPPCTN